MKRLVASLFLLNALLFGCNHALPFASSWDLLKIFFPTVSEHRPVTGTLIEFFPDGKVKSLGQYRNGRREGLHQRWHAEGTVHSVRYYHQDRKVGIHRSYWPDGQRQAEFNFTNGRLEGPYQQWYESGRLYLSKNYFAGRESGLQKAWGPKGEIYSSYVMEGGRRYGLVGSKPCFTVGH